MQNWQAAAIRVYESCGSKGVQTAPMNGRGDQMALHANMPCWRLCLDCGSSAMNTLELQSDYRVCPDEAHRRPGCGYVVVCARTRGR